ncbi:hypothetical protein FRC14_004038 [Serendipita sp. 396]|nr:hypothetical protein FRC14_004038 [Serendipita sp. 396]KAG8784608.1 hypothetical protein FRC15_002966 [Serendipita sp. 397]KAG8798635.1 hypothetical protein FRC16_006845 [Serendipita sp. 398]KAG8825667.1 hypothetical protein FRC19_010809 [Serendipita sp. 401]KAG8831472.1 hypothetical protein FRC18_006475 [Serendipita sp. 400]KAG8851892.1 hypothetical protein FRB91_007255 [Serendipita sp. 411]KAG8876210.1 hypothetical protein FRC20_002182 [Serendipita sp. 405]KAG9056521.1 hypothetical prot
MALFHSLLISLFCWTWMISAIPTWMQDDYEPDLVTVVNYDSSGGDYYLKSSALPGQDGDCIIQRASSTRYSKDHERFAPNFFVKGGNLYAMTNNTHVLQAVALTILDKNTHHYVHKPRPGEQGRGPELTDEPTLRYKLQLVDTTVARKNTGVVEKKYAPGKWSWSGPILLYDFGPQHVQTKGCLFYSCHDGVYVDVNGGAPPVGCEGVTLHSRNVLRLR